jgi:hypothetical protein
MHFIIQKYFKSIPLLYKFWFKINNNKLILPGKSVSLYFDGYPRSGNTYFTNILIELYPNLKFSHHLHTISPIKLAIKNKIPVIIIIRDPLECIASLYVMKSPNNLQDRKLLNRLIYDYIEYFNFILLKKKIITFVSFNKVIKNPKTFIDILAKTNTSIVNQSDYQKLHDILQNKSLQLKQKNMTEDHATKYSSTPNEIRTSLKKIINEKIMKHPKINEAIALFDAINNC